MQCPFSGNERVRLVRSFSLGHSNMSDLAIVTKTADFAARAHRDQRRKNKEAAPYINHPIGVAHLATSIGGVTDIIIVQVCFMVL